MTACAVWCLLLFAIAAANDSVRASGVTRALPTDSQVAVVGKPSEFLFGRCPVLPAPTMNVRLQALKTKSGAIFRRKAVTEDVFTCLSGHGSVNLTATTIKTCSEQTEAAGLETFRWDGGQCTGYTTGLPENIARCDGSGPVVLYSVTVAAESLVVSNITISFYSSDNVTASWDVTPDSCFVAYRVNFDYDNSSAVQSQKSTVLVMQSLLPCAEYHLSVTPVGSNSAEMGPTETAKVVVPKALDFSFNVTHGVTAVTAAWKAEYTCNPQKPLTWQPVQSYEVTLGSEKMTTNASTFNVTFGKNSQRCSDILSPFAQLRALDGSGAQVGVTAMAFLPNSTLLGHRYTGEMSSNCIYYQLQNETSGGVGLTYDQLLAFCAQTMLSTPFTDDDRSLTSLYISEIAVWERSIFGTVSPHFVGAKRDRSTDKWMWMSGVELVGSSTVWDAGEPGDAGDCVELNANKKLAVVSCDATDKAVVCYDYLG